MMELTREVLEAVRNDRCDMPLCSDCIFSMPKGHPDARLVSKFEDVWCSHPGLITVATFALALMDERDRYREALELIDRTTRDYGIGIGATCNNAAHYALEPVQREAVHAEADQ